MIARESFPKENTERGKANQTFSGRQQAVDSAYMHTKAPKCDQDIALGSFVNKNLELLKFLVAVRAGDAAAIRGVPRATCRRHGADFRRNECAIGAVREVGGGKSAGDDEREGEGAEEIAHREFLSGYIFSVRSKVFLG